MAHHYSGMMRLDEHKPPQNNVVDTVGAGDAFASILCLGYLNNWELKKINELANEFAGQICMINGALPKEDNIYTRFQTGTSEIEKTKKPTDGLYIQLYSIHGLIRGHDLELGRDADTGGQTKYVFELAKTLSEDERVERVELVTRQIKDKVVSSDYSVPEEKVNEKFSIIRVTRRRRKVYQERTSLESS